MGSRIMHAVIAHRIAEQLPIQDLTTFLWGSVAPDAVPAKAKSHFFTGEHRDFSRSVDYKGFLNKYSTQANSPYILGYYTHLIADDIWLKGFYLPWLGNRIRADKEVQERYYQDFKRLNGQLLEHYGLREELKTAFRRIGGIIELEEVSSEEVEAFLPYVLEDLEYDQDVLDQSLDVFTFEQIIGYLETSAEVGILHLKQAAILHRLPILREWV